MANRNYFNALAGLKLEDTPTSSPTAAAAASKRYVCWCCRFLSHMLLARLTATAPMGASSSPNIPLAFYH
mgnify:CR=1 FL=1